MLRLVLQAALDLALTCRVVVRAHARLRGAGDGAGQLRADLEAGVDGGISDAVRVGIAGEEAQELAAGCAGVVGGGQAERIGAASLQRDVGRREDVLAAGSHAYSLLRRVQLPAKGMRLMELVEHSAVLRGSGIRSGRRGLDASHMALPARVVDARRCGRVADLWRHEALNVAHAPVAEHAALVRAALSERRLQTPCELQARLSGSQ
jgi:hypothetical protein